MVEFQNVSINFATQEVLCDVNLRVSSGERIGIVGPNGSGKSTMFQLILGNLQPDSGKINVAPSISTGFVKQHPTPATDTETLLEYSMRGAPRIHELEAKIRKLEIATGHTDDTSERNRLLRLLGDAQTEYEHIGGYDLEVRVKEALGGLGFNATTFSECFRTFSGGWRMRAELARILASRPDLLLLDEPSNYLDLPAVEWLQRFLVSYDGTLLIISHDRYLLRSLTKLTVEVDAGAVTRYAGDFDYYMREREVRTRSILAAKANQDRRREQLERFIDRFRAQANKAAQAQSRIKLLEKMEDIRVPKRGRSAGKMRLQPAPHCGVEVMRLENVTFRYSAEKPPILSNVNLRINRGDRIGVVGFNGMGKTTLLRILAGVCQPVEGSRVEGFKVLIGYQSQDFAETISPEITVLGCAKRTAPTWTEKDLRTQLGSFGFTAEDIDKPAGTLSGGERIRLAFFRLFLAPPNFLLLDEPTTHLDVEGRMTLEEALGKYDGTICFVSHDVEFVRAIATSIIEISPSGLFIYPGTYDEYRDYLARRTAGNASPSSMTPPDIGEKDQAQKSAPNAGNMTAKDLRRAKADIRAKLQPKIAPLKKRVDAAEKKIAALEAEEQELATQMASGDSTVDYAATGSQLRNVQMQLHVCALDWENAATELEKAQSELASALEGL